MNIRSELQSKNILTLFKMLITGYVLNNYYESKQLFS